MDRLEGKRVLIVGASSGLGHGLGLSLAEEGAHVAFAARRLDRVQEAAEKAGGRAIGLSLDVCDPASVDAAVAATVEAFGGLDAFFYCPAYGPLTRLADAEPALWQEVLTTNVIGASQITRATLPHLAASGGRAIFVSSILGSHSVPWPGLGLYGVSKAALERLIQWFAAEHPEVAFTRFTIGPTAGGDVDSEFSSSWDPEVAAVLCPPWIERGLMDGGTTTIQSFCDAATTILTLGRESVLDTVVLRPRPQAVPLAEFPLA